MAKRGSGKKQAPPTVLAATIRAAVHHQKILSGFGLGGMGDLGEVIDIGYAMEAFPIRRVDAEAATETANRDAVELRLDPDFINDGGWKSARAQQAGGNLAIGSATRGHHVGHGVVSAIDRDVLMDAIFSAVHAIPTESLYSGYVDETKREQTPTREDLLRRLNLTREAALELGMVLTPLEPESDRDLADERIGISIILAFENLLWPLLYLAVDVAKRAAMIVGRDAAETPGRRRLSPGWPGLAVQRVSDDERAELARICAESFRTFLRDAMRDRALVRRVGRQAEEDRDHRAYCLRERLLRSEEFAAMKSNVRFAQAKVRVIREVISPAKGGLSDANFWRVMGKGKAIHRRLSPSTPFCERDDGIR